MQHSRSKLPMTDGVILILMRISQMKKKYLIFFSYHGSTRMCLCLPNCRQQRYQKNASNKQETFNRPYRINIFLFVCVCPRSYSVATADSAQDRTQYQISLKLLNSILSLNFRYTRNEQYLCPASGNPLYASIWIYRFFRIILAYLVNYSVNMIVQYIFQRYI